jgi:hypothetical protein
MDTFLFCVVYVTLISLKYISLYILIYYIYSCYVHYLYCRIFWRLVSSNPTERPTIPYKHHISHNILSSDT